METRTRLALRDRLRRDLDNLERRGQRRTLSRATWGNFYSNDYLALSDHPSVLEAVREALDRGVPIGSTGSRLLSVNHEEHVRAEETFADFIGRERGLLLGSGFAANQALLSTVAGRRDLIVYDSAAHASIKEGARSALAQKRSFAHNDVDALRSALRDRESFDQVFVVVEGIYSMDGDVAPLRRIDEVVCEQDAHLIVDEAHGTGLFGEGLRGAHEEAALSRPPLATVHPCGKAVGASGAFIAADSDLIDFVINTARPFIFSTAPSPIVSVALRNAFELMPGMRSTADHVLSLAKELRTALTGLRSWSTVEGESPIVPVIVGESEEALRVATSLREKHFDVRAIRPPTVPKGTARLRLTLTARHDRDEVQRLGEKIVELERSLI